MDTWTGGGFFSKRIGGRRKLVTRVVALYRCVALVLDQATSLGAQLQKSHDEYTKADVERVFGTRERLQPCAVSDRVWCCRRGFLQFEGCTVRRYYYVVLRTVSYAWYVFVAALKRAEDLEHHLGDALKSERTRNAELSAASKDEIRQLQARLADADARIASAQHELDDVTAANARYAVSDASLREAVSVSGPMAWANCLGSISPR